MRGGGLFCFRWLAALFLFLALSGCATPPLPPGSEPVVGLMAERLELARDVAWAKWADGLPVRDPARERLVLAKLCRQGTMADIDEVLILRFARAQIEASCLEQEAWMKRWREGTPLPAGDPPALGDLRLRLERLSAMLLAEYAAAWNTPPTAAAAKLRPVVINPRSATVAASGFVPE